MGVIWSVCVMWSVSGNVGGNVVCDVECAWVCIGECGVCVVCDVECPCVCTVSASSLSSRDSTE